MSAPVVHQAVRGYRPTKKGRFNLRDEAWSWCLDQRVFGPRRLLVAFADARGRYRGVAHTRRSDPPEEALGPCIDYLGRGATYAVAYCDEPVSWGPPPDEVPERFALARSITASYGLHLVDWFACDDDVFRSFATAVHPEEEWWELP